MSKEEIVKEYLANIQKSLGNKMEWAKCIKCGDILYDRGVQSVPSEPKEDNLCAKCAADAWAKLPLSERIVKKTIGYGFLAGAIGYFATTKLVIKPTIRKTKELVKQLSDWSEKL
jgi:hypothetical protein